MTFYLGIFQYIYAFISLGQIFESAISRLHDQYILTFASKHIILQFGCADVQVYLSAIYENYDFYATHGLLFRCLAPLIVMSCPKHSISQNSFASSGSKILPTSSNKIFPEPWLWWA